MLGQNPPTLNDPDLSDIPWKVVRNALRILRQTAFPRDKPEYHGFIVGLDPVDLVDALGRLHWHPNWEFSYYYKKEQINLARPERFVTDANPDLCWYQTHVRGWDHPNGTEIHVHHEPAPTEHPKAHLSGRGYDRHRGRLALASVLEDLNMFWTPPEGPNGGFEPENHDLNSVDVDPDPGHIR